MQIKSLELFTANLPQLLHFYRDVLACNVVEQEGAFVIKTGATDLIFRIANTGIAPVYHFAFTIPENKFDEAVQWTAGKVKLLEVAPGQFVAEFKNWDAASIYFFDPAGNIVEFIIRRDMQIFSDEPFSGASLSSVSEIGLVTDDVTLACRQLEEIWNVPHFSKLPPAPNFAAVGDDAGLFIVVSEGRPWFPTNINAAKAPLTVVFETTDGVTRTLQFQ